MENPVNDVYEVFKEYYGEDRVDLQETDIIVHFPEVTVTNEHDQSVIVKDLYVKTPITSEGKMNGVFTMTRSTYPMSQVQCDYLHSHVISIPYQNYSFSKCCTGRGPIVRTMALLSEDADLDRWRLYCYELDKYTQVESEEGIPYHHLKSISRSTFTTKDIPLQYKKVTVYQDNLSNSAYIEALKEFIPYLINKQVLHFNKHNDHYFIAHPFLEYLSIITTAFVEFKENNIDQYIINGFLLKGTYENGIFKARDFSNGVNNYNPAGNIACKFKGEDIIVTVEYDLLDFDDSKDLIIKPDIANYLLYKLLAALNYGNAKRQKQNITTEEVGTIIL